MKLKIFLPVLFLFLFRSVLFSQQKKFDAGFIAGLNFAELEGDGVMDYFGLNVGLIGTMKIAKKTKLGIEFLFSQNGEYILPEYYPQIPYGRIRLNHIEIPFHIDWLIGVFEREEYYDWNLNLGVAYTRLLSYQAEDRNKNRVDDQFIYGEKEAYLLQAGTTYHFSENLGLNFKASIPILVEGLEWTVAARLIYLIK